MKNKKSPFIFLLIILFQYLLFIGCGNNSKKNNEEIGSLLSSLKKESQVYSFSANEKKEIIGKDGTRLFFPVNIFAFDNDEFLPDNSEIKIELSEFYKSDEMILNSLSTESNQSLLETGGMIYLQALCGEKKLKLIEGKNFFVLFPKKGKEKKKNMLLFQGQVNADSNLINWIIDGDTISDTNFGIDKFFQEDTVLTEEELNMRKSLYEKSLEYYIFKSSSLEWLNCDRFVESFENSYQILANVDTTYKPVVRLIYKENNSISAGYEQENKNEIIFKPLPIGRTVTLFAFSKKNGKIFSFIKEINSSKDIQIDIDLKETTLDNLKRDAATLEWKNS